MPGSNNPPVAPWARAPSRSARPPQDEFYGYHGKLRYPYGHVWSITGPTVG